MDKQWPSKPFYVGSNPIECLKNNLRSNNIIGNVLNCKFKNAGSSPVLIFINY